MVRFGVRVGVSAVLLATSRLALAHTYATKCFTFQRRRDPRFVLPQHLPSRLLQKLGLLCLLFVLEGEAARQETLERGAPRVAPELLAGPRDGRQAASEAPPLAGDRLSRRRRRELPDERPPRTRVQRLREQQALANREQNADHLVDRKPVIHTGRHPMRISNT